MTRYRHAVRRKPPPAVIHRRDMTADDNTALFSVLGVRERERRRPQRPEPPVVPGRSGTRGSDVHVIIILLLLLFLLVRLALQRRLLARRLLHLQRRLAQGVFFHRGCRLRRQDDVLYGTRQQGAALRDFTRFLTFYYLRPIF